jgi:hypothetical protein
MHGVRLRKWVGWMGRGGRPEGLVTGDLLVVGVILVGSFTGGTRHSHRRSLELRASGPLTKR